MTVEEIAAKLDEWSKGKSYINFPGVRNLMAYLIYPDDNGHSIIPALNPETGVPDLDAAYDAAIKHLGLRSLQ